MTNDRTFDKFVSSLKDDEMVYLIFKERGYKQTEIRTYMEISPKEIDVIVKRVKRKAGKFYATEIKERSLTTA